MPSLTIKGVSERLLRRLKRRARQHRRSLNSEVLICLEQAADHPIVDPVAWLEETDRLRARLSVTPMSEAALRRVRGRGRP